MIYVFRPTGSASARQLANEIDAVRIKHEVNLLRRVKTTDKVVMWGAHVPNLQGRILNNVPLRNKFEDAIALKAAGVATVEVSRTKPTAVIPPVPVDPLVALWEDAQEAAEAFTQLAPNRNPVTVEGVRELLQKFGRVQQAIHVAAPVAPPPQPVGEWLARKFNHVGGNDLLNPNTVADYYSKKEAFVAEYRVHSFFGKSIRAGKKIHRTPQSETPFNGTPHQWVRSFDAGWMLNYGDDSGVKQKHRDLAHAAVKALGLHFGAVDIGERADGTLIVLEVNRAPGVEGGTTEAYGRAIRRWLSGEWQADGTTRTVAA